MAGDSVTAEIIDEDPRRLAGLLGFAEGVLRAREKVQMEMQAELGVFHEYEFVDFPGVHLDSEDGTWLRIDPQRETAAPEPPKHVTAFLISRPKDPTKQPQLRPTISVEVTIEEASDLEEGGLLKPDDIRAVMEGGIEVENRVMVLLHSENLPEMRRDFERYLAGAWSDWAERERPVRRTIAL